MIKLKKIMFKSPVLYTYDACRRISRQLKYSINPKKAIGGGYKKHFGYFPDIDNPTTFNEKLQWIKLYYHNPMMTDCVDKYKVRDYVKSKGLARILNDVIGVYRQSSEIDYSKLPEKFILKANHGSGWNVLCLDKEKLDIERTSILLDRWLHDNFFYHGYEWVYKNIDPLIICEKYIQPENGIDLKDYKFFCFNGRCKFIFVASGRAEGKTTFDFYTPEWEWIPVKNHYCNAGPVVPKPDNLSEMIEIAQKLSEDFPHVRVDLYCEFGKIYFGELTFGHFSGVHPFEPHEYDIKFGDFFLLPEKMI